MLFVFTSQCGPRQYLETLERVHSENLRREQNSYLRQYKSCSAGGISSHMHESYFSCIDVTFVDFGRNGSLRFYEVFIL